MAFFTVYFFIDYLIAWPIGNVTEFFLNTAILCTALATGVGIINMLRLYLTQIKRREPYWYLRIWSMVMMVVTTAVGLIGVWGTHPTFKWIMLSVYAPIDSSIYSMVAYDICSAFYRTIRARNIDSSLILIMALFVMAKNAPIGEAIWSGFVPIGEWIMEVPSTAGSRGFVIVSGIGALSLAIRAILGREKEILGG